MLELQFWHQSHTMEDTNLYFSEFISGIWLSELSQLRYLQAVKDSMHSVVWRAEERDGIRIRHSDQGRSTA